MLQTEEEDTDSNLGSSSLEPPANPNGQVTYFKDGKRKIDFILVYETVQNANERRGSMSSSTSHLTNVPDKKFRKAEQYRERFMANLKKTGLEMEAVRDMNIFT